MKPTEAQLAKRLPVWEALSEFFLDTELQPSDHDRIAGVLAASKYSVVEIENILIDEVCPVCKLNMYSVAGEWMGFDTNWLKERMSPRFDKRPRFRFWSFLAHRLMYARHWKKVKARMLELRAN
jgi:hypothetical protein